MIWKIALSLVLGCTAASAVIFYFWDEEINEALSDEVKKHRELLDKCLKLTKSDN